MQPSTHLRLTKIRSGQVTTGGQNTPDCDMGLGPPIPLLFGGFIRFLHVRKSTTGIGSYNHKRSENLSPGHTFLHAGEEASSIRTHTKLSFLDP